jgi:hypothetical protein
VGSPTTIVNFSSSAPKSQSRTGAYSSSREGLDGRISEQAPACEA